MDKNSFLKYINLTENRNCSKDKLKSSLFLLKNDTHKLSKIKKINIGSFGSKKNNFYSRLSNKSFLFFKNIYPNGRKSTKSNKEIEDEDESSDTEQNENKLCENYDDLFYYFLKNEEKIPEFELEEIQKENTKNNMILSPNKKPPNFIFYYLYSLMTKKIKWKNFYFPRSVFLLLYRKSRKLLILIHRYETKSHIHKDELIKSYNKKYLKYNKKKHNWLLTPETAYKNYYNNVLIKDSQLNKEKTAGELTYEFNSKGIMPMTDVVVKTNNNGEGKTLLFIGNLLSVYVEDYINTNRDDNIISMEGQDIRNTNNPRKQVIYAYNESFDSSRKEKKLKSYISKEGVFSHKISSSDHKFTKIKINKKSNGNKPKNNIPITKREKTPDINLFNKPENKNNININKKIEKSNFKCFNNLRINSPIRINDSRVGINLSKYKNNVPFGIKKYKQLFSSTNFYPFIKTKKNINESGSKSQIKSKIMVNNTEINNNSRLFTHEGLKTPRINNRRQILNFLSKNDSDFYY